MKGFSRNIRMSGPASRSIQLLLRTYSWKRFRSKAGEYTVSDRGCCLKPVSVQEQTRISSAPPEFQLLVSITRDVNHVNLWKLGISRLQSMRSARLRHPRLFRQPCS